MLSPVAGRIVSAVELHVLNGERHLVKKTMKFAGVQVYKIQMQAKPTAPFRYSPSSSVR